LVLYVLHLLHLQSSAPHRYWCHCSCDGHPSTLHLHAKESTQSR
jgi:hypothetical protein